MTVWLAHRALAAMQREGRELFPLETGGVLLGWRRGEDRIVIDVVGPGRNALHGRTRFMPDHKWQMREITRVFTGSAGDIDYLGDWHTHPDGHAIMSDVDCRTLAKISRKVPQALMLILAGPDYSVELACWKAGRKTSFFSRLLPIEIQQVKLFEPPYDWPAAHAE